MTTEQAHLEVLYSRLDAARERAAADLDRVRRAPIVPTPAGRAERDAFDAWHSERLAHLRSVEERLCFGRLDLVDGGRRYIGRLGLSDEERTQLLVDWRAPAAAAFYQATQAAPDGVVRRRHIATRARKVTGVDDDVLDAEALADAAADGVAGLGTVAGEGALMAALTAHRTSRMRDIVATLQAEQDRIVRAPLQGTLVVQGGPGTGKTAVALHRAAYLLYTHRDRIARSGVLVVGPTPVFLRYIEQVLPSLGETGVVLATPGQLFPGVEASTHDAPEVARIKGDLRMATVIRQAVRRRQRVPQAPVPVRLDGETIVVRPRAVAAARGKARSGGRPHNEARVTFVLSVLEDLTGQLARARKLDPQDQDSRAELEAELRASKDVRREINLLWMPLTPAGLVSSLYRSPARLADAAAGTLTPVEQELLFRETPDATAWSIEDVPLLDEAAELIGDDVPSAGEYAQRLRERSEALAFARAVLDNAPDAAVYVTAEMLADRFTGNGGPVHTLSERATADRSWVFGHAVVDEAQELSPMQWRLLTRRVPSRSMTVVGDVAQTSAAAGTTSWADALDVHAEGRWRVEELTINYRTPSRIMALATAVLHEAGIDLTPPEAAREGDFDPAVREVASDLRAVARAVVDVVRADDVALSGGRFAAVASREASGRLADAVAELLAADQHADPGDDLADRLAVHSVESVKGLEFDGVVVLDPVTILGASRRGPGDLYVALTRTTQRLTVLHFGDLPASLAPALSRAS
jgi:DNA helicase IV